MSLRKIVKKQGTVQFVADERTFLKADGYNGPSRQIVDETAVDEYISTALAHAERVQVSRRPQIVKKQALPRRIKHPPDGLAQLTLPIPRRPLKSQKILSAEELRVAEDKAYVQWRREMIHLEKGNEIVVSPYEKNPDFWRQLWRCVEVSSAVVVVLDCRNPRFFLNNDLLLYIKETGDYKKIILLLNKADLLNDNEIVLWSDYFTTQNLTHIFYSATDELRRQTEGEEEQTERVLHASGLADYLKHTLDDLSPHPRTVGFVGFPNVGKSSIINSLYGSKKVSMSHRPGKTKHVQTLILQSHDVALHDCPGLVMPSAVATKDHLLINGVTPLETHRGGLTSAVDLIMVLCRSEILGKYNVPGAQHRLPTKDLLDWIAESRGYIQSGKRANPDGRKVAMAIIKDYIEGGLHYVVPPPTATDNANENENADTPLNYSLAVEAALDEAVFATQDMKKNMTKRRQRFMEKNSRKSKPIAT